MSVVITTYCNQFIAMCADRQRTSTFTGEEQVDAVTKVESLSPSIAIGRCGNLWLSDLVLSIVKGTIEETGIDNVTTEEVADLFCQAQQFAREEDPEITDAMGIRFVVAGKLSNGELGVIVVSLGNGTFDECSGLVSVVLPSNISSIGSMTFHNCGSLNKLVLPSSVTCIGEEAFEGCGSLTSIIIPIGVTKIHRYAFSNSGLTSLNIPSSVVYIGDGAFEKCSGLTSVCANWKNSLSIDSSVFKEVDKQKCILYVPQGTLQDYRLADVWGDFENIVEYDVTGVDKVITSTDTKEVSRYSVNGQRLSALAKGLNIVKYSDGSVKKVAVQ